MPKQQKEENVIRVSVMTKLSWASEGDQSDREISDITLRLGLNDNLMAKSLNDAIAKPFLKAFCKRKNMPSDSIRPSEVQSVLIDGRMITAKEMNYATSSLLTVQEGHQPCVELILRSDKEITGEEISTASTPDLSKITEMLTNPHDDKAILRPGTRMKETTCAYGKGKGV